MFLTACAKSSCIVDKTKEFKLIMVVCTQSTVIVFIAFSHKICFANSGDILSLHGSKLLNQSEGHLKMIVIKVEKQPKDCEEPENIPTPLPPPLQKELEFPRGEGVL